MSSSSIVVLFRALHALSKLADRTTSIILFLFKTLCAYKHYSIIYGFVRFLTTFRTPFPPSPFVVRSES